MSIIKRLTGSIEDRFPITLQLKWWVKGRPQPLYLPRLPNKLMPDEVVAWVGNRPKVMK